MVLCLLRDPVEGEVKQPHPHGEHQGHVVRGPHNATLPIDHKALEKLFRKWDWDPLTSGTKHAKFRKGNVTVTVRRGGKMNPTWEPVRLASQADGCTPEQWLAGPKGFLKVSDLPKVKDVDEEDLTWFIQTRPESCKDREDILKYRYIRKVLSQQGLLNKYLGLQENIAPPSEPEVEPLEPLPVEPDNSGSISLAEALALKKLKKNALSNSSCEMIAALSEGEIHDANGQATRRLLEKMPCSHKESKPLAVTGLSALLKGWEDAGLIWRETNGKRTYKIGLCIPVNLDDSERLKYLGASPEPEPEPEEVAKTISDPGEIIRVPPEPAPRQTYRPSHNLQDAIDILKAEQDRLEQEVVLINHRILAVQDSIKILEDY